MKVAPLIATLLALSSCGGGSPPSQPDLSMDVQTLPSGLYRITALASDRDGGDSDGCWLDSPPGSLVGVSLQLTHDATNNITIDNFGSGKLNGDRAILSGGGSQHTPDGKCTYLYTQLLMISVTAVNSFTGAYSETETMRLPSCTPAVGGTCTSTWTMDATKQ